MINDFDDRPGSHLDAELHINLDTILDPRRKHEFCAAAEADGPADAWPPIAVTKKMSTASEWNVLECPPSAAKRIRYA